MAKQIAFEADAWSAVRDGVTKLARAVKMTLGPRGRLAMLDKSWGAPNVTKDGVTVAEDIHLENPCENIGAQLVREVASKTSDVAGDGTTTATVLAEALYLEGLKNVTAGASPVALKRGMDRAVAAVVAELEKMSVPVKGRPEKIRQIARVASNNDAEVGKRIAEAFDKVGEEGVITIEEGKALETTVEVVKGMQFDRGYLSPHFVTDPEEMVVELEKAYVLIYEKKLSTIKDLIPLLEKVSKANRPLLIIAEDIDGEALAPLVVNRLRGVIQCCAVKAPGFGDRRRAMLEDIAVMTGGKAIFEDLGLDLTEFQLSDLGQAKKIRVDNEDTLILQGAGSTKEIEARAARIRREIEEVTSDYDREKLQERLARLVGGIAEINVGAATESEMKEKKARYDDALSAARAAIEEGVVPGGGVAYLRCEKVLDSVKASGDEKTGVKIVRSALPAPLRQIAENAGTDGGVAAARARKGKAAFGFDAEALEYCDLAERGILDPAKVAKHALQNASSVAGLLLMTMAVVTEKPEKKSGAGPGPGMEGMGDEEF